MAELRPIQPADVETLYGKPLPVTVRGFAAVDGERLLGMGAIYPSDGCMVILLRIAPEARKELPRGTRLLLQGARRLLRIAAERHLPVRAVCDRLYPRSAELLEHLGFRHIQKDVYEWTIQA